MTPRPGGAAPGPTRPGGGFREGTSLHLNPAAPNRCGGQIFVPAPSCATWCREASEPLRCHTQLGFDLSTEGLSLSPHSADDGKRWEQVRDRMGTPSR
jgi:hypothetical protein